MYSQMNKYFNPIRFKYQFGFREAYSAQHCLLAIIEKWRVSLDQNGAWTVLLTDFSQAFDLLLHNALISKLHAYGYDIPSLKFLNPYLRNRHQRVKTNNLHS